MKIYFGFTVAGDRSTVETARSMVQCLEDLGHEVLTRHLVSDDARAADRSLGPQAVYQRDMAWLRSVTSSSRRFPVHLSAWASRRDICSGQPQIR